MAPITPGPWELDCDPGSFKVCGAGGAIVAAVVTSEADAVLIIVAPDMLAALKSWQDALRNKAMSDVERIAFNATRTIIAKVEGT